MRFVIPTIIASGTLFAQETEDIRGPKPLIDIPKNDQPDYAMWMVGVALVVCGILCWLAWKHFSNKRKPRTACDIALADLSELESQAENIRADEFAERAALTVRRYISAAFGIAAPNRTSEEFFRELPASSVRDKDGHLHSFLKSCDLAKFAAAELNAAQRIKLMESAKDFVRTTTREGGEG